MAISAVSEVERTQYLQVVLGRFGVASFTLGTTVFDTVRYSTESADAEKDEQTDAVRLVVADESEK